MKLSNASTVPVYTISGSSTARPLPEWLARKRKRSLKTDPEYANRIELLQDFEFEEASSCVRVSEDGEWVMSTGTYKPQIHVHNLSQLSLSYSRHTNTLNKTFVLLSPDATKSLHLQSDRQLEFHRPEGLLHSVRIPRYGRDLLYSKRSAEALIPSVGVNEDGNGEVFRLNLEIGRFMKAYELDVGGDDLLSMGGGALQGGIDAGAVNTAAIAEGSHGLMAFGTSIGTVEFFDPRHRSRVGAIRVGPTSSTEISEVTALQFHSSGLSFASGLSNGLVYTYDLRSPLPLLTKDQGYGFPIQTLKYLSPTTTGSSEEKLLSSDKRIIKIWDATDGTPWTSVEPAVDLHHVEHVPGSGMLLTANEGRQQHSFFIPALGPAPRWCSFLDNVVEEMAEDTADPNAYASRNTPSGAGEVYDNYKFLDAKQLRELNLDHLVGTTNLLRPYMHGYFVAQRLYEQARLISNPYVFEEARTKSIQDRINKERESRIRGNKKINVKVNRRLAEKMAAKEAANEERKARRVLKQGGDALSHVAPDKIDEDGDAEVADQTDHDAGGKSRRVNALNDPRFASLFQDEDLEIDEHSREFALQNPSSVPAETHAQRDRPIKKGLTAVEEEAFENRKEHSSDSDSESEDDEDSKIENEALKARQTRPPRDGDTNAKSNRLSTSSYKKTGHQRKPQPKMSVSSLARKPQAAGRDRSFGALAEKLRSAPGGRSQSSRTVIGGGGGVGEKEITFEPVKVSKKKSQEGRNEESGGRRVGRGDRRSASGNVFRRI
ncbi:Small ribosomal subunit biogenesis [Elasticomyces elasticus]|nr:Small ribosomal subunit biogenesis [Elasticomyces elasticus]